MSEVKIFETTKADGNMNTAKAFYPDYYDAELRKGDFLRRRMLVGEREGFDGNKFFMVDQMDKNGSFHIFTEEDVKNNPTGWGDFREDIGIISEKYSNGIVVGHPVADCPVLVVTDRFNGISAIAHCSGALINDQLPAHTVEAIIKAAREMGYKSEREQLEAHISSCAGPNWTYDKYPAWATNERLWMASIHEGKNGIFNINIKTAVIEQLYNSGISLQNISSTGIDTITNPNYYSNCAGYQDPSKKGRFFAGAFYPDEEILKEKYGIVYDMSDIPMSGGMKEATGNAYAEGEAVKSYRK